MTPSERRYTLAGLGIALLACLGTWLALPQIQQIVWPPKHLENTLQEVDWVPNDPTRGTGACVDRCAEFISWSNVKKELERQVLPKVKQIPLGSSLSLVDSRGRRSWVIQVKSPQGIEVAHLWMGSNPVNSWRYDGLVHVGSPKAPVALWASFQRYSDGIYRRKY